MTYAFIVSPTDLLELKQGRFANVLAESFVCSHLRDIDMLPEAEQAFFVVSKYSMGSTAYQEIVLQALVSIDPSRCRVFRLDEVRIPDGFQGLQLLPEGNPFESR